MAKSNAESPHGRNKKKGNAKDIPNQSVREYSQDEPYKKVKVLLLTFKFTDLKLSRETRMVENAFRALGYEVSPYEIEMDDSENGLRRELRGFLGSSDSSNTDTLLIVYYHGHGGLDADNQFSFVSHNYPDSLGQLWETLLKTLRTSEDLTQFTQKLRSDRNDLGDFQLKAEASWETIRGDILSAKNDVLIILDCCEAGAAAVDPLDQDSDDDDPCSDREDISDPPGRAVNIEQEVPGQARPESEQEGAETGSTSKPNRNKRRHNAIRLRPSGKRERQAKRRQPRKELIGACGWGVSTMNHMSPAMCKVLKKLRQKDDSISAYNLAGRMNNRLVRSYDGPGGVPQAVHYVLRVSGQRRDPWKRMAARIKLPYLRKETRPKCEKCKDEPPEAAAAATDHGSPESSDDGTSFSDEPEN